MAQISAQNFNRLRQRILNVVNNSDYGTNPQTNQAVGGYGQTYTINSATVGGVIGTLEHRQLYQAIAAARLHQTGSLPILVSPIDEDDIIGQTETKRLLGQNVVTDDLLAGYDDMEAAIAAAEADLRNDVHHVGSRELFNLLSTTRSSNWGNTQTSTSINCEFQVDFGSTANARKFFNTGGDIRISAQHNIQNGVAASAAKDTSWQTLLNNFSYILKSRSSAGTAQQINQGWAGLTNSYAQVGYYANAGGGVYAENYVKISAKVDQATNTAGNSRYLYIKVELVDADTGDGANLGYNPPLGVDEFVSAGTVVVLSEYRANAGQISTPAGTINGVAVAQPSVTFLNGNEL